MLKHSYKLVLFSSVIVFNTFVFAEQSNTTKDNSKNIAKEVTHDLTPLPTPPTPISKQKTDTFKIADNNSDGKISFDEFLKFEAFKNKERDNKQTDQLIKGCDKNKDGMISVNELVAEDDLQKQMETYEFVEPENLEAMLSSRCMLPKEMLEMMDDNEDGVITREELMLSSSGNRPSSKKREKKMQKKMLTREANQRKKSFSKCDANSDEILTLREAVSMHCYLGMNTEQFDAYDTDGDSIITIDELAKEIKRVEYRPVDDPKMIERRRKMPPFERMQSAFYECDKDEDGQFSKAEAIGAKCEQDLAYFDTVDHNLDGYISNKEMQRIRLKKSFDRMDKNKDGTLDSKEYKRSMPYSY